MHENATVASNLTSFEDFQTSYKAPNPSYFSWVVGKVRAAIDYSDRNSEFLVANFLSKSTGEIISPCPDSVDTEIEVKEECPVVDESIKLEEDIPKDAVGIRGNELYRAEPDKLISFSEIDHLDENLTDSGLRGRSTPGDEQPAVASSYAWSLISPALSTLTKMSEYATVAPLKPIFDAPKAQSEPPRLRKVSIEDISEQVEQAKLQLKGDDLHLPARPTSALAMTHKANASTASFDQGQKPRRHRRVKSARGDSVSNVLRRLRGEGLSKEYWMKDENSKECFECKSVFNPFRRRHHCRICGQIFCASCAHRHIPGEKFRYDGLIRVCNYCYELMQANPSTSTSPESSRTSSDCESEKNPTERVMPFPKRIKTIPLESMTNSMDLSVNQDSEEMFISRLDRSYVTDSSSDNGDDSMLSEPSIVSPKGKKDHPFDAKTKFEFSKDRREYELPKIHNVIKEELCSVIMKPSCSDGNDQSNLTKNNKVEEHRTGRSRSQRQLLFPAGLPGTDLFPLAEAPRLSSRSRRSNSAVTTRREADPVLFSKSHLKKLLFQMLQEFCIPDEKKWEPVLMDLLVKASSYLCPDIVSGDDIDIRGHVKIKRVPGGLREGCEYLQGVMFSKCLMDKRMPRRIEKPRILALTFALEYQRIEGQYMSLEPVIAQEREYLRNLVTRIVSLRPSLVLVEKSVAKIAKDFLVEANVAVAANVKPSVIAAVSRCTKAEVISSMDKLVSEPRLGSCGLFRVRTFQDPRCLSGWKSYIVFEKCPAELGGTLLLRGESPEVLGKIKRIMDFMVFTAYNQRLEKSLLKDLFLEVSNADIFKPEDNQIVNISIKPESTLQEIEEYFDQLRKIYEARILSMSPGTQVDPPYPLVKLRSHTLLLRTMRERYPFLEESISFLEESDPEMVSIKSCYKNQLENVYRQLQGINRYFYERGTEVVSALDYQKIFVVYEVRNSVDFSSCHTMRICSYDFYGIVDMTLGQYLEDMMTRASERCPAKGCDRPLAYHIRNYLHDNQKIQVSMEMQISPVPNLEEKLLMWSECKRCNRVSPVVTMSSDTWKYSISKFLELSFHGSYIQSRSELCSHSHPCDRIRYFGLNSLVVKFQQSLIEVWDIAAPPILLQYKASDNIAFKNKDFDELEANVRNYYSLLVDRVARFNFDAVIPALLHEAEMEMGELGKQAHLEHIQFLQEIEKVRRETHPTDTLAIVIIKKMVNEKVIFWDTIFEDFSRKYLHTPEKELKRLTTAQLRKLWNEKIDDTMDTIFDSSREMVTPSSSVKYLDDSEIKNMASSNDTDAHDSNVDIAIFREYKKKPVRKNSVLDEPSGLSYLLEPRSEALLDSPNTVLKNLIKDVRRLPESGEDSEIKQKIPAKPKNLVKKRTSNTVVIKEPKPNSKSATPQKKKHLGVSENPLIIPRPRRISQSMIQVYSTTRDATKIDSDEEEFSAEPILMKNKLKKRPSTKKQKAKTAKFSTLEEGVPSSFSTSSIKIEAARPNVENDNCKEEGARAETIKAGKNSTSLTPSDALEAIIGPDRLSLVRTISNLWLGQSSVFLPLEYPFPPTEHIFSDSSVVVLEDEPSSIIAFALSSQEYQENLLQMQESRALIDPTEDYPDKHTNIESMRSTVPDIEETLRSTSETHIKYQFSDGSAKFFCKIFFAEQFDALRRNCECDTTYAESLARCIKWDATGGKSGSLFLKTRDDRLVMKQMSRPEMDAFLKTAPAYFAYMSQAFFHRVF